MKTAEEQYKMGLISKSEYNSLIEKGQSQENQWVVTSTEKKSNSPRPVQRGDKSKGG